MKIIDWIKGLFCDKAYVVYLDPDLPELAEIHGGDWVDLRAASFKILKGEAIIPEDGSGITYAKGALIEIGLGFSMTPPKGKESIIAPRSGTNEKYSLIQGNSIGVIDESYAGTADEWKIRFYAFSAGYAQRYDRIAQFRTQKKMRRIRFIPVSFSKKDNRGGFGSTGRA